MQVSHVGDKDPAYATFLGTLVESQFRTGAARTQIGMLIWVAGIVSASLTLQNAGAAHMYIFK